MPCLTPPPPPPPSVTDEMCHYKQSGEAYSTCLEDVIEAMRGENPPLVLTFNRSKKHYNAFRRQEPLTCPQPITTGMHAHES